MATQEIVLGTDSWTFWTGNDQQPWLDDPREAKVFTSAREAWLAATNLQKTQAEYLEESAVELHVRDPEEPRLTRVVTSLAHANNRPRLRAHWRKGFGEALPPDMPTPVAEQDLMWRLGDYLDDVDWRNIRIHHNGAPERAVDLGFDPAFRDALVSLSTQHPEGPSALWRKHVPADFPTSLMDELVLQDRHAAQQRRGVARLGIPEALPEPNEIVRDRDRETGATPSVRFAQNRGDIDSRESDTRQPPPLPSFVRRHFVRTDDRFYYRQTPERLAFIVRGETLRAEDASVSVATALVELAESRGWSALRVKGSQDFRRLVWAAAIKRGLSVEGYSPSAGEHAMLEQEPEPRDRPRRSDHTESRTGGRERPIDSLAGVLVGHGAAPYQHQQSNSPSYFVSLRGPSDEVATHWGLDLERALGESGATVGDRVQLSKLGKQRIPVRNDSGDVIGHESKADGPQCLVGNGSGARLFRPRKPEPKG